MKTKTMGPEAGKWFVLWKTSVRRAVLALFRGGRNKNTQQIWCCKKLLVAEVQVLLIPAAEFATAPVPWVHRARGGQWRRQGELLLVHCSSELAHLPAAAGTATESQLLKLWSRDLWGAGFVLWNAATEAQQLV